MSFYDFTINDIDGEPVNFNNFKNKVILIVNVASKCGFTKQYKELEELHQKYFKKGLIILGFPCRQFAFEEYDDEEKIKNFCSTKYNVTFKLFSLTKVKGKNISPLYKFLIENYENKNIKWNFEKFLINKNGHVINRFASNISPKDIEEFILKEIEI